jgi:hypothetical protein
MNTKPPSLSGIHSSRSGREVWIAYLPAIIVVLWFFGLNMYLSSTLKHLEFGIKAITIPVSVASLIILLTRIVYPANSNFKLIAKLAMPSALVYPVVCLFFLIRSNTGPNGAGALIYFMALGGVWLIVSVILATLLGSSVGRWLGKKQLESLDKGL